MSDNRLTLKLDRGQKFIEEFEKDRVRLDYKGNLQDLNLLIAIMQQVASKIKVDVLYMDQVGYYGSFPFVGDESITKCQTLHKIVGFYISTRITMYFKPEPLE